MKYYTDFDYWFYIDLNMGPISNDNKKYSDRFLDTLNALCNFFTPRLVVNNCVPPRPDLSPTHKNGVRGIHGPVFGDDNASSLTGLGGDDAA